MRYLVLFFILLLSNESIAQSIHIVNGQQIIVPQNIPYNIIVEQPPYYPQPAIRYQTIIYPPYYIQPIIPQPYVIEKQYLFRRERIIVYPQYGIRIYE